MNTTVYLIRHCLYHNPQNLIPFRLPGFPLSLSGKKCAQNLGQFFISQKISGVFTSPILRAKQTAQIIGQTLGLKPHTSFLITETRSPFQGWPKAKFDQLGGNTLAQPFHLQHGGETSSQIFARTKKFIDSLLKNYSGQNIIIITHGDPITSLVGRLVDQDSHYYTHPHHPYIPMGGIIKLGFTSKTSTPRFSQLNY